MNSSHAGLATVPLMSIPCWSVEERATPMRPYHGSWMKVMSKESENVQDDMHAHIRTCNIELEDMK